MSISQAHLIYNYFADPLALKGGLSHVRVDHVQTSIGQRYIDSAISSLVFYLLIQFSLQISDQWRTASSLMRGSRGVMATWLIADSYAALSVNDFI